MNLDKRILILIIILLLVIIIQILITKEYPIDINIRYTPIELIDSLRLIS